MSKGNGIEEMRRFVRARVSTISSFCPICKNNNKNNITKVRRIAELHHIFGRSTRNPKHVKESVFGVIPLCYNHHQEYAPLQNVESYERDKRHWDKLFEAYWTHIGYFNFLSDKEKELRRKLMEMGTKEMISFFLGDNTAYG